MKPSSSGLYPQRGKQTRSDKNSFGRKADQTNRLNTGVRPKRGGFRL